MESEEASEDIEDGDVVLIDVYSGEIINETKNKTYREHLSEFIQDIIKAEGLINYIKGEGNRHEDSFDSRGWNRA